MITPSNLNPLPIPKPYRCEQCRTRLGTREVSGSCWACGHDVFMIREAAVRPTDLNHYGQRKGSLDFLIRRDGPNCHYCGVLTVVIGKVLGIRTPDNAATRDHKVPISKGGSKRSNNQVIACNRCNRRKGDRGYEEFMAEVRAEMAIDEAAETAI